MLTKILKYLSILIFISCTDEQNKATTTYEDSIISSIIYTQDPRTQLCFVVYSHWNNYGTIAISNVPCTTEVIRNLQKVNQ